MRKQFVNLFFLITVAHYSFGQAIIDSCFFSVTPSTNLVSSNLLANMSNIQADMLEWTGSNWIGSFPTANITIPPPTNVTSCRAVFIGHASQWTTGGEGFGLLLDAPLVAGQTYSYEFNYVSHGTYSDGSFSPAIHTNSLPLLGFVVGNLPPAGFTWTATNFTFTATSAQAGHTWLIITTAPNGSSGLINSFCQSCSLPPVDCSINLGVDTTLCFGETLTLDPMVPNATYLWQDNTTTPTYFVNQPGIYIVQITANNCTSIDTIFVNYDAQPIIDIGADTTLCQGQTILLNATTPNASYLWQDNSSNPTFLVSQPGTYIVEASIGGCMTTDSITVAYNLPQSVVLGNDTTLCLGASLQLDATTPNATYLWQDNSTNPTLQVTQQGSYWVQITTDNCTSSDTILVDFSPTHTVQIGNDTILCNGETLLLDATASMATYLWQDNSTNSSFNVTQPGIYWVEVTIDGCIALDTIEVDYRLVQADLGNDTLLCQGNTLLLDVFTSNATYLWQDNSTNSSFQVTQQGTYEVQVTVDNCVDNDTIVVSYNQLPIINLGMDTILCEGAELLLDVESPNATYLWQDNSTNSSFNVTQPGIYSLEITLDGCSAIDSIVVEYRLVQADLGNDTLLCQGDTLQLEVFMPNATYLWQDNSTNSSLQVTQQGTYEVKVTVDNCIANDTIEINYNQQPMINLGIDTTLCEGEELLLDVETSNATYLWQDNSTSASFTATDPGTYWVQVNVDACESSSDTIVIEIEECNCNVSIPNAFSPNQDGFNDQFAPLTNCTFTSYDFKIFNRWGENIFESTDHALEWDGTQDGKPSTIGVYVYLLTYQLSNSDLTETLTGDVTLLR